MDDTPEPSGHSSSPAANWQVWRIDDNGNTFLMREQLSHEEAEQIVAEFTTRGHKQTYWAEQALGR